MDEQTGKELIELLKQVVVELQTLRHNVDEKLTDNHTTLRQVNAQLSNLNK
jgi:hypothetical protein